MDMDLAAGLAMAKAGFDTLRTAAGLVKDAQGLLPAGEKKDVVARTLEEADRQVRLGEAQIAQALGYPLCRCAFPPTPMLKVGWRTPFGQVEVAMLAALAKQGGGAPAKLPVHECPRCNQNDVGSRMWTRTAPQAASAGDGA